MSEDISDKCEDKSKIASFESCKNKQGADYCITYKFVPLCSLKDKRCPFAGNSYSVETDDMVFYFPYCSRNE